MVLLLRFNQKNKITTVSGDDESGNGNHFILRGMTSLQQLQARSFGLAGNGACYCSQFAVPSNSALDPNVCDRQCDDGSAQSCGSTTTAQAVSVYTRGTIQIGSLAPSTEYEFTASFVTIDGDEFDISQSLVAKTQGPTLPGRVSYLSVAEHLGKHVELQWMSVEDDGGAKILKYQVFVNGYLEFETANGDTNSAALDDIDLLPNCTITVCAVNELGAGPQQMLLTILPADSGVLATLIPLVPINVTGGSVTFSTADYATSSAASSNSTATLVIQQRESSLLQFTNAFTRANGTQVTVYKLRHDTSYVFRAYSVNAVGSLSAFSAPVIVQTGKLGAPGKTPTPIVTQVTGGSISMLLTEPLDTGGLQITTFNIFAFNGTEFAKLTSVAAGGDGAQVTTLYRDLDEVHLSASTTYTFKVLALQYGGVCEELSTNEQESDSFSATTTSASIPFPPLKPSLIATDGCVASTAIALLRDHNGAIVSEFNIRLSTGSGVVRTSVADYDSRPITLNSLMPFTNYSITASVTTDEGDSAFSEPLWFTTGAPTAPSKLPVFKVLEARSSSLVLQWTEPESSGGGAIKGKLAFTYVQSAMRDTTILRTLHLTRAPARLPSLSASSSRCDCGQNANLRRDQRLGQDDARSEVFDRECWVHLHCAGVQPVQHLQSRDRQRHPYREARTIWSVRR